MRIHIRATCFVLLLLLLTAICMPIKSSIASNRGTKQVTVNDNGQTTQYVTGVKSVDDFFNEIGLKLYAKDLCSHAPEDALQNNTTIQIERGFFVTVRVDSVEERKKVSPGTTVEALLIQLQQAYDTALLYDGGADPDSLLGEDDYVAFLSWRSERVVSMEVLPIETMVIETTALRLDAEYIRQTGQAGQRRYVTETIYIGGVATTSAIIEDVIVTEMIPTIIDKGIGGMLGTTTDVNAPWFQYVRKLTMNASAYTAGYESTGKRPGDKGYGITRSGLPVEPGIVSVDPRVIPLGTKLYVEGYGYSLAADTGSGIVGHMIDLYYEDLDDALAFGRKNLTVYILE